MDLEACHVVLKKTFRSNGRLDLLVSIMHGSEPSGDEPVDPQPGSQQLWCIVEVCHLKLRMCVVDNANVSLQWTFLNQLFWI